ncbi:MAG: prepilin-type N-terminal cleavage/methylation domain-containing protein [Comamonadaceae bacterium]|nr:MAG: prepilin-type N-terminal cleavage/methylation domain-containing protein [Comamonadaceae bacterium]
MAMKRAQQGFTLIEVMVALVLMAVVSLVSWRGLESVVRIREHVERDAERDATIVRVMGQLERDVQMRAPDYVLEGGGATATSRPSLLPTSVVIERQDNAGVRLEVVRLSGAEAGGWQRIRWWLEAGTLRRAVAQTSDRFPLPQAGPGATILENVTAFGVRAYVPGQGWTPATAAAGAQSASGLEFVVELAPTSGIAPSYRRVVALP